MLYFLYGTDSQKTRKKLDQLVTVLKTKKPLAPIIRLTNDNFVVESLNQAIEEQSLFTEKNIIILDGLLKEHEEIIDQLKLLQESEHICMLVEEKVSEKNIKTISGFAEKVEEHNEGFKKDRHINFEITDAFAVKNNLKAWSLYTESVETLAPEEIHGTIMWQIKTILVSMHSASAKEAGISPFAYQKAKSASKMWTNDELSSTQNKLFKIYHDARRGNGELGLQIEKFLLKTI